ncbi:hypothetical protein LXA43DRAFT_1064510 [Ganoderma leucocontextum]|nr:hypothetical protein LXA43DRAFT_1064510 [Ganoderma leucocontextum]
MGQRPLNSPTSPVFILTFIVSTSLAICLTSGLLSLITLLVAGPMAKDQDIHTRCSNVTEVHYRKMQKTGHYAIVLSINRDPGHESMVVALTRTFGHRTYIEPSVPQALRGAWMPVIPATLEDGITHGPIEGLRVNIADQTVQQDHVSCWVYLGKRYEFRLGYQYPRTWERARGPTDMCYPNTSLAIRQALVDKDAPLDVVGTPP